MSLGEILTTGIHELKINVYVILLYIIKLSSLDHVLFCISISVTAPVHPQPPQ